MDELSEIGARGLVIAEGDQLFYVKEDAWRQRALLTTSGGDQPDPLGVKTLARLKVAVAKLERGVFVNLDALAQLEDGDMPNQGPRTRPPTRDDLQSDAVVLYEKDSCYVVPRSQWKPLARHIAGDAGVLVTRGAVVAAVPANEIPTGTYCVLVNWSGLAG